MTCNINLLIFWFKQKPQYSEKAPLELQSRWIITTAIMTACIYKPTNFIRLPHLIFRPSCFATSFLCPLTKYNLNDLPVPFSHASLFSMTHLRTNLDVNLLKIPVAPCVLRAWLLPCDSDGDAGPPV